METLKAIFNLLDDSHKLTTPTLRSNFTEKYESYINELKQSQIPHKDFPIFLRYIHDACISRDPAIRSLFLRAIRYCVIDSGHCASILEEDFHLIVTDSLEKEDRENYYLPERIQALKLVIRVSEAAPSVFPISFARSIVAVASLKEDSFSHLCLETLRKLAIANPKVVSQANGIKTLFEAVLDPDSSDIAEPIMLTLLYLLNKPSSRRYTRPHLDLQTLLAPITDLDTQPAELLPRRRSAHSALVLCLRSWAGISLLASDDMALRTLVKMLRDPKVSRQAQDAILDCFTEAFEPVTTKHRPSAWHSKSSASAPKTSTSAAAAHGSKFKRRNSSVSSSFMTSGVDPASGGSSWGDIFASRGGAPASPARYSGTMAANSPRTPDSSTKSRLGPWLGNSKSNRKDNVRYYAPESEDSSHLADELNATAHANTMTVASLTLESEGDEADRDPDRDLNRNESFRRSTVAYSSYQEAIRSTVGVEDYSVENNVDSLYNLVDSYSAYLTVAFLHVNLVDALIALSTSADVILVQKSRDLLVSVLRVVAAVLPERWSSELLVSPSLVQFAASIQSRTKPARAHKATQMLIALADAFSVSDFHEGCVARPMPIPRSITLQSDTKSLTVATTASVIGAGISSSSRELALETWSVEDLCVEVVQSSSMRLSSGDIYGDVLNDVKQALVTACTQTDLQRQLDNSRVTSREPWRWDWSVIGEVVEHSFQNVDRLSEALKTKWVKRVCQFFLCVGESKALFPHLDWQPNNLIYLEYGIKLYRTLSVHHIGGSNFLDHDRCSILCADISKEISMLIEGHQKGLAMAGIKTIFKHANVQQLLTREYFSIIGRLADTATGRRIVDGSQISQYLASMGKYRALDYMSRAALTGLIFADGGHVSNVILQSWLMPNVCSEELHKYSLHLLRALSQCHPTEFFRWGLEVLAQQLGDNVQQHSFVEVIRILKEAAHDRNLLKLLISKRLPIIDKPAADDLLIRFPALPEGLDYLIQTNWIGPAIKRWVESECLSYCSLVESKLANALARTVLYSPQLSSPLPIPIHMSALPSSGSSGYFGGVQLEGLIRLPWNIEVKVYHPRTANEVESLKVDCFIDISDLPSRGGDNDLSDDFRVVRVRGLILDPSRGGPSAQPILSDRHLKASLLIGVCPVLRSGRVLSPANESFGSRERDRERSSKISQIATVDSPDMHKRSRSSEAVSTLMQSRIRSTSGAMSSATDSAALQAETEQFMAQGRPPENLQDWFVCAPANRFPNSTIAATKMSGSVRVAAESIRLNGSGSTTGTSNKERQSSHRDLGANKYAVEVGGEPVRWIFNRKSSTTRPASQVAAMTTVFGGTGEKEKPKSLGTLDRPKSNSGIKTSSTPLQSGSAAAGSGSPTKAADSGSATATIFLEEVQFLLRIKLDQSLVVPLPRHLFGELARTTQGLSMLISEMGTPTLEPASTASSSLSFPQHTRSSPAPLLSPLSDRSPTFPILSPYEDVYKVYTNSGAAAGEDMVITVKKHKNVISTLLHTSLNHQEEEGPRRAALWAIAHIACVSDDACGVVLECCPLFLNWCTDQAITSPNFSMRGTCFMVCGLFSRTSTGMARLQDLQWESCALKSSVAVAVPRNLASLFVPLSETAVDQLPPSPTVRQSQPRASTSSSSSIAPQHGAPTAFPHFAAFPQEREVLELIVKLPGHLLMKDSLAKLEAIKQHNPVVFSNRALYIAVHNLFAHYQFRLPLRRRVLALFTEAAKLRECEDDVE